MVINKLSRGVVTLVLSAIISRTLGAEVLGQYVLGISFFYIFVNLASQGFKTLFTREIARDPESTPLYLVNGLVLQLSFCIISYLALLIVIFLLPYSTDTRIVCYIIGLAVIPFGLSNIT
ncbi:MAG: oligosaccharide flippase family protein, partial [Sphaerospermopsis sp. SIO1G2]|nr:oligosaccharide flippase family protein [Sphaerospermopsis sp. SIO1G2]